MQLFDLLIRKKCLSPLNYDVSKKLHQHLAIVTQQLIDYFQLCATCTLDHLGESSLKVNDFLVRTSAAQCLPLDSSFPLDSFPPLFYHPQIPYYANTFKDSTPIIFRIFAEREVDTCISQTIPNLRYCSNSWYLFASYPHCAQAMAGYFHISMLTLEISSRSFHPHLLSLSFYFHLFHYQPQSLISLKQLFYTES